MIPSRCAASVATVDLPVPVAPPTSSDDRDVERAERRERAEPDERPAPPRSRRAARTRASRSRSSSTERRPSRSARAPGGSRARRRLDLDPGGDERPLHQRFRVGKPVGVAERQRVAVVRLIRRAPPRAASASSASSSPGATRSLPARTTRAAAGERVLGDEVDRRALELDQVGVGVELASSRRSAVAVAEAVPRRGRPRRRGARVCAGPAVNTATRPASGASGAQPDRRRDRALDARSRPRRRDRRRAAGRR